MMSEETGREEKEEGDRRNTNGEGIVEGGCKKRDAGEDAGMERQKVA